MEPKDKDKEKKKDEKKERDEEGKRSFTIREMEISDLYDVYKLGEECFKADLWPMLYRSWDEYEVTSHFNTDGEYCLVAENDDESSPERIVGFVLGTVIAKAGSAWNYGYIKWICAHPNWAREGVASKLTDEIVELMVENDGIRIMMADTDPDNVRAVSFFQRLGFDQQKPHIYLTSNLESNERWNHLIHQTRVAAMEEEYWRKIKRLAKTKVAIEAGLKKKKKPQMKRPKGVEAPHSAKPQKSKKKGGGKKGGKSKSRKG